MTYLLNTDSLTRLIDTPCVRELAELFIHLN